MDLSLSFSLFLPLSLPFPPSLHFPPSLLSYFLFNKFDVKFWSTLKKDCERKWRKQLHPASNVPDTRAALPWTFNHIMLFLKGGYRGIRQRRFVVDYLAFVWFWEYTHTQIYFSSWSSAFNLIDLKSQFHFISISLWDQAHKMIVTSNRSGVFMPFIC